MGQPDRDVPLSVTLPVSAPSTIRSTRRTTGASHHVPDSYCHLILVLAALHFLPPTVDANYHVPLDTWLSGDEMESDDLLLVISPLCASVFSSAKWDQQHSHLIPSFLPFALLTFGYYSEHFLVLRGWTVGGRIFSSILGLYLLDNNSTNTLQTAQL